MAKTNREKNIKKVPKITEAQYEEYIMSLKEETPVHGFDECAQKGGVPKLGKAEKK